MQVEIRLAESGHSYHYSQLTNVHSLMQEVKKDFKIELEDQKIIMKSGQILKSNISFDSLQQLMKKTLSTNFPSLPSTKNQIKQIQCIYVYNQKQLLRPIQSKTFNQDLYLKNLKDKCKQMALLAQNSYESKNFNDKVIQKNVNTSLQSINKRLKTPLEDISQRYSRFLDSLNQRSYTKMQISALLDLIQNQDKARKLLIRNIEYLFDRKTKKRFISISQKVAKQVEKDNQVGMKESSSFFSNSKQSQCSEGLNELTKKFKQIQLKFNKFYDKLKQSKKQVTKGKFLQEEKKTFNIDKKTTLLQKEYEQNVKIIKGLFDQFCEQTLRINLLVSRTKQKEVKDLFKNLLLIHDKIYSFERKVQDNIKEFTAMFLELSKIHMKGESQNIKGVFQVYVDLIRSYEELDVEIKKMEKQITLFKQDKSQSINISEFSEGRNLNMPLKKSVRSPKKQENKSQNLESSISKELQNNVQKINSPIKNKMGKNNIKLFNEQITSRNFESALKENKQLSRRLSFNKRLQNIVRYCSNMCQKQQELRRGFRNSKQFEENKIDLLGVLNVPSVEIDFSETGDVELTHLYKKWMMQKSMKIQSEVDWDFQVVECVNSVNKTLTAYLAGKQDSTERERNLQKILCVLSDSFYSMMNKKLEKQIDVRNKKMNQQFQNKYKGEMQKLRVTNKELSEKIRELNEKARGLQSKISYDQKIGIIEKMNLKKNEQQMGKQKQNESIRQAEEENMRLKEKIRNLSAQFLNYRQEVDQTTQKLIESYEESHGDQIDKINHQLKIQKDKNISLNNQIRDLKTQLEKAKKNLIRQVETCETLCRQIEDLEGDKYYYQKEFSSLKQLLADKQVAIIKLQKQLAANINNKKQKQEQTNKQKQGSTQREGQNSEKGQGQSQQKQHTCQYQEEVIILRQEKQALQQEIQSLDNQLKEILFKQTQDQEVQTQIDSSIPNQTNITPFMQHETLRQNIQTSKISDNKFNVYNQQILSMNKMTSFQTKPINTDFNQNNNNNNNKQSYSQIQNHLLSQNNFLSQDNRQSQMDLLQKHAVSKYYMPSIAQQWISTFPSFSPICIGKSIEEGMSHIFLPFSGDIYIGVTANQQNKNYHEYLSQIQTYSKPKQPTYILDIKDYNHKTTELIRECSLVLVIKIDKKSEVTMGNKVMVSGKIQYALGFEDQDMTLKNYSHFLQQ